MAAMTATPTATPAAMAATFGPFDLVDTETSELPELVAADWACVPADSVTTTVLPGATLVTMDGLVVVEEVEDETADDVVTRVVALDCAAEDEDAADDEDDDDPEDDEPDCATSDSVPVR